MPRDIVFTGRKIQLAIETSPSPAGVPVRREVVLHPGAVVVLPLLGDGRVCLLRNRRFAVGETLWELPAGTLEPPEPPEAAAARELEEEAGYRARRWRRLADFYSSPGIMTERLSLYLATDLTAGTARPDPGEEIRAEVVNWDQAVAWALDGTIRDAKSLIGILLWDRLRQTEPAP